MPDKLVRSGWDEASRHGVGTTGAGAWWLRQLVLGPGPEVIVVTDRGVTGPMETAHIAPCEIIDGHW
jgi:hypothetical protein